MPIVRQCVIRSASKTILRCRSVAVLGVRETPAAVVPRALEATGDYVA
jgi:hypothetical protein